MNNKLWISGFTITDEYHDIIENNNIILTGYDDFHNDDDFFIELWRICDICNLEEVIDIDFYKRYIHRLWYNKNLTIEDCLALSDSEAEEYLKEFLNSKQKRSIIMDAILEDSEDLVNNKVLKRFLDVSGYKILERTNENCFEKYAIFPKDKEELALLIWNPANCYQFYFRGGDHGFIGHHVEWISGNLTDEDINRALIRMGFEDLINKIEIVVETEDTMDLKAFDSLSYPVRFL